MDIENHSRSSLIEHINGRGGVPKAFRIWDELHHRWFQGEPSQRAIDLQTDAIHFFGEIMVMEGTLFDQNEDDAWKNSPEVKSSIDMMNWLVPIQWTGEYDELGHPIYEGDILITDDNLIGVVTYDRTTCSFNLDSPYHGTVMTLFNTCIIKGNIFEHFDQWFSDLDDEEKWTACCKGEK